jgi:predicted RNA-binding Zn ribbon-like protein
MAPRRRPAPPSSEIEDANRTLAFVNTLSGRPTPAPQERLASYAELAAWARESYLVSGAAADRLAADAKRRPAAAAAALARARQLREAIHEVLLAMAAGRAPATAVLDTLAHHVSAAYANGRLTAHEGALQWVTGGGDELDRITWDVARAAARLVTSARLGRVRACEAGDCAWWFVDDTRNHSRRWCDMKICGNREKLRRFRARSGS